MKTRQVNLVQEMMEMPWSKNDYPDSMKNLPDETREKAIEIANAVLEEDHDEGKAIRIGIAQAKKYTDEE